MEFYNGAKDRKSQVWLHFLANEASFEKQETAEKFDKSKEKSVILSEMKMYENNPSTRPPTLEKLYKALMTIPPTSVESERTFSTASFYGNKIREPIS